MRLVITVLDLYSWVIIIRALLSWVITDPRNQIVKVFGLVTEPVLKPLRGLIPPEKIGGIDVSPLLVLVLIQVVRRLLIGWYIG